MVSELIDQTLRTWNKQLMNEVFLQMDSNMIMSIPLCTSTQGDFWAWHYEKSGMFTVRSAYRMMVHTIERVTSWLENTAGRSNTKEDEKEWNKLWKEQVPSKVRVFLWRLAHQSIPTQDIRQRRKMADNSKCNVCGREDSWKHSLLECHMAKAVWSLEHEEITGTLCMICEEDANLWLAAIWKNLHSEAIVCVVIRSWAIWHAKWKVIHENIFQCPLSTHLFVERYLEELKMSKPVMQGSSSGVRPSCAPSSSRWLPPPHGLAKINTDGAVSKSSDISAAAAIARDEDGTFLGASALVLEGITDPETIEPIACREGLALAADLLLRKFRLASDCANAVKNIHGEGFGTYGPIVKEIKVTSATFAHVEFVHERRSLNVDAHRIAKSATSLSRGRHVWFLSPPDGVCNSIIS